MRFERLTGKLCKRTRIAAGLGPIRTNPSCSCSGPVHWNSGAPPRLSRRFYRFPNCWRPCPGSHAPRPGGGPAPRPRLPPGPGPAKPPATERPADRLASPGSCSRRDRPQRSPELESRRLKLRTETGTAWLMELRRARAMATVPAWLRGPRQGLGQQQQLLDARRMLAPQPRGSVAAIQRRWAPRR